MSPIQILQLIGALFTVGKDLDAILKAHEAEGKTVSDPLSAEHTAAVEAIKTKIASVSTTDTAEGFIAKLGA